MMVHSECLLQLLIVVLLLKMILSFDEMIMVGHIPIEFQALLVNGMGHDLFHIELFTPHEM